MILVEAEGKRTQKSFSPQNERVNPGPRGHPYRPIFWKRVSISFIWMWRTFMARRRQSIIGMSFMPTLSVNGLVLNRGEDSI